MSENIVNSPDASGLKGALKGDLASFWKGFSQPSSLAFTVFLLSLAATLCLCLWFFSERSIAGPLGRYLPRSALDPEAFVTREALREGLSVPTKPRLLVLGTSTVAKVVMSGQELEQEIERATGQDWRVVVMALPRQSPTDQFALIDRALQSQRADSPPVVIAVGISPQRLRWTNEEIVNSALDRRIGLRSDWEDREVILLGGTPLARSGLYPLENRKFVLLNGARSLLRMVLQRPANRWSGSFDNQVNMEAILASRKSRGDMIRAGFPDRARYYAQLERLAAHVAQVPNARLMVIEETMSPDFIADQSLERLIGEMKQEVGDLAAKNGFEFCPAVEEANLNASHYIDDIHLDMGEGQDRVRHRIVLHLQELLK